MNSEIPTTEVIHPFVPTISDEKHLLDSLQTSIVEDHCPTHYELCTFHQLPAWLKDNSAITEGYRVNFSFKLCLLSIFKLHNGKHILFLF